MFTHPLLPYFDRRKRCRRRIQHYFPSGKGRWIRRLLFFLSFFFFLLIPRITVFQERHQIYVGDLRKEWGKELGVRGEKSGWGPMPYGFPSRSLPATRSLKKLRPQFAGPSFFSPSSCTRSLILKFRRRRRSSFRLTRPALFQVLEKSSLNDALVDRFAFSLRVCVCECVCVYTHTR